MKIAVIWRQIRDHPLARKHRMRSILRAVRWRFAVRRERVAEFRLTDRVNMRAGLGMHGITGNIYLGLIEFEACLFATHLLRPDEMFFDGGAHHGTYALLLAAHAQAQVVAIEPQTSARLELTANVALNQLQGRIGTLGVALGDKPGRARLSGQGATAHIAQGESGNGDGDVAMTTIDSIARNHRVPTLCKLDLEGFEALAVRGATQTLADPKLQALVIETNGLTKQYGMTTAELLAYLAGFGFMRVGYDPFTRNLSRDDTPVDTSLLVKDLDWATARLRSSAAVSILGDFI